MSVSFLVAPSGFKESLSVGSVTDAIARGVLNALPDATILKAPMVDGGEGFVEALVAAKRGSIRNLTVCGPVGKPVKSFYGLMNENGSRCAVIEMAAAAGLRLVPRDQRDPCMTTSFGVGQLIRAALDDGVDRILLGCGDSGINDAGAGMLQALGCRLLDANGCEIGFGGAALLSLSKIDSTGLHPRLKDVRIDAAVNIHNVLLGPRGVSRVFGPQKGATPEQVELLERALTTFADCIRRATGTDVALLP
jgi:glycerate 2-kinase